MFFVSDYTFYTVGKDGTFYQHSIFKTFRDNPASTPKVEVTPQGGLRIGTGVLPGNLNSHPLVDLTESLEHLTDAASNLVEAGNKFVKGKPAKGLLKVFEAGTDLVLSVQALNSSSLEARHNFLLKCKKHPKQDLPVLRSAAIIKSQMLIQSQKEDWKKLRNQGYFK
jgi:hypothetical protein